MKVIKEESKTKIILEDKDVVEISSLMKNKEHIEIKCLNGVLHIEDFTILNIKEKKEEEKAIKKMKEYLDNNIEK